jgi:hypothetical protein
MLERNSTIAASTVNALTCPINGLDIRSIIPIINAALRDSFLYMRLMPSIMHRHASVLSQAQAKGYEGSKRTVWRYCMKPFFPLRSIDRQQRAVIMSRRKLCTEKLFSY